MVLGVLMGEAAYACLLCHKKVTPVLALACVLVSRNGGVSRFFLCGSDMRLHMRVIDMFSGVLCCLISSDPYTLQKTDGKLSSRCRSGMNSSGVV